MTAFNPLVGRLFQRTLLRQSDGSVLTGILAIQDLKSQSILFSTELLDTSLKLFSYRITIPTGLHPTVGDTVTVANTESPLVVVGEVLKVVSVSQSSIKIAAEKLGTVLYLVSNTIRVSANV